VSDMVVRVWRGQSPVRGDGDQREATKYYQPLAEQSLFGL
jgi:hypothetical protein